MDERGVITAHGPFDGLDRFEARPGGRRGAARAGPDRRREAARTCTRSGTARGARPRSSRGCRCSGSSRSSRWPRPPATRSATAGSRIHPAGAGQALLRLGRQHARLVHLPPAVVGPPHPGLVRPGRRDRLRRPGRGAAAGEGWTPGPRRAGHLVLLGAVAVLHAGLARADRRPGEVLPDHRAGHRLRHPVLLGRPDDDVRPVRDGRPAAVRRRGPARHGPRPARQEDVQVARQRRRPAGLDRRGTAPTRSGSPWPAAPTPARDVPISEEWVPGLAATSATSCGTPPGSR